MAIIPEAITRTPELHRRLRGHAFYPSDRAMAKIPPLYATDGQGEAAVVRIHYFASWGDWFITELDPATGEAFGWAMIGADPFVGEWGYIDLPALESAGGPFTIVERDLYFEQRPAAECLPEGRHRIGGESESE